MIPIPLFLKGLLSFKNIALMVVIAGALAFGYVKWTSLVQENLQVKLDLEKKIGDIKTLEGNLATAKRVNEENQSTLDQLQIEKKASEDATKKMRSSVATATKQLDDAKRKIAEITTPAVPLTPRLSTAIGVIQDLRGIKPPVDPSTTVTGQQPPKKVTLP